MMDHYSVPTLVFETNWCKCEYIYSRYKVLEHLLVAVIFFVLQTA